MDIEKLRNLLDDVQNNRLTVAQAMDQLRYMPYDNIGYAQIDTHRALRKGLPEVVFCQNKTIQQALGIFDRLISHHGRVMGTRVSSEMAEVIVTKIPEAKYDPLSRILTIARHPLPALPNDAPYGVVVTGGTADLPVAEEAAQTMEFFGSRVERYFDVGVAGLHRLLDKYQHFMDADVIISIAGMEGALTSVVGGIAACPVIGVPTSIGYGANFNGLSALLSMLNSCAPGVVVVNIDNGFGAGQFAHMILSRLNKQNTP